MVEFKLQLADSCAHVKAAFSLVFDQCKSYLTTDEQTFSIIITPEDIAFERQKVAQEDALEGHAPRNFSDAMLEITAVQRKIAEHLFGRDILVFHGSCVAVDGAGYLFTAKSGTGKSTHTRLWREVFGERAVMVNDDKPFLKIQENSVTVYGSPWNGKHGLGSNIAVPLKGLCILERGEENRIQQIKPENAVIMLLQQSQRPRDPRLLPKYMELVDKLSKNVKLYQLQCNMDPQAAQVAYQTMSEEERYII